MKLKLIENSLRENLENNRTELWLEYNDLFDSPIDYEFINLLNNQPFLKSNIEYSPEAYNWVREKLKTSIVQYEDEKNICFVSINNEYVFRYNKGDNYFYISKFWVYDFLRNKHHCNDLQIIKLFRDVVFEVHKLDSVKIIVQKILW